MKKGLIGGIVAVVLVGVVFSVWAQQPTTKTYKVKKIQRVEPAHPGVVGDATTQLGKPLAGSQATFQSGPGGVKSARVGGETVVSASGSARKTGDEVIILSSDGRRRQGKKGVSYTFGDKRVSCSGGCLIGLEKQMGVERVAFVAGAAQIKPIEVTGSKLPSTYRPIGGSKEVVGREEQVLMTPLQVAASACRMHFRDAASQRIWDDFVRETRGMMGGGGGSMISGLDFLGSLIVCETADEEASTSVSEEEAEEALRQAKRDDEMSAEALEALTNWASATKQTDKGATMEDVEAAVQNYVNSGGGAMEGTFTDGAGNVWVVRVDANGNVFVCKAKDGKSGSSSGSSSSDSGSSSSSGSGS